MIRKKLFKAISLELSEARAAHRGKKWNIAKECLLHIKYLIEKNVKT